MPFSGTIKLNGIKWKQKNGMEIEWKQKKLNGSKIWMEIEWKQKMNWLNWMEAKRMEAKNELVDKYKFWRVRLLTWVIKPLPCEFIVLSIDE